MSLPNKLLPNVSQEVIESLKTLYANGKISSLAIEELIVLPAPTQTTVSGAGISQMALEALSILNTSAYVSTISVEVLLAYDESTYKEVQETVGQQTISYAYVT